jgi:hypothetical protein
MNLEKYLPELLDHSLALKSFFGGGFECSTFRRRSGLRLDLIASTFHDRFAQPDYQRLAKQGMRWAREGVRWHLVEGVPGRYDFSSVLPIVRAARATGTQVIWDLCHFGWPEHIDLFQPEFVHRLSRYGQAFANWLANETNAPGYFVPVNEISYFSWAAGDEGSMFPFVTGRGFELKAQLVRASIETMKAIWNVRPEARFVHVDPIIHVINSPRRPLEKAAAEAYRQSQFQAFDMLAGRVWPELGGEEKFLDIVGVNFYPHNQWFYNLQGVKRIRRFTALRRSHPLFRPFREMIGEIFDRYHRPIIVSETGAEDRARRGWLRYVCQEVAAAIEKGVPLHGICLYPILNHPGWVDDRHCYNGLWDYADKSGKRKIYSPLAAEIRRWRKVFENHNANRDGEMSEELISAGDRD